MNTPSDMTGTSIDFKSLQNQFKAELHSILNYWAEYTVDDAEGGFYGALDNDNHIIPGAIKGSVLNARILWSFSAGYHQTKNPEYLKMAARALTYIRQYFVDPEFGGVYWSVNHDGTPHDTKKQIYALAFTIYGLSEYCRATPDADALGLAKKLFLSIEEHSFDTEKNGYLDALSREWAIMEDIRLSDKDANEKKTMNTHLHIMEAYANLYRVWPDEALGSKLRNLISLFEDHIIDTKTYHLDLFFNDDWQVKSQAVSYGHDIEASWLLLEAAEVLGDEEVIDRIKKIAIKIADAAAEGLNSDGSLSYELIPETGYLIAEKHWWVQAEAIVGFFNAWQITDHHTYLDRALASWNYIQQYIIDHEKGEWFWGINADGTIMAGQDKAGLWKCPYHNSRACLEMIGRLKKYI